MSGWHRHSHHVRVAQGQSLGQGGPGTVTMSGGTGQSLGQQSWLWQLSPLACSTSFRFRSKQCLCLVFFHGNGPFISKSVLLWAGERCRFLKGVHSPDFGKAGGCWLMIAWDCS